jgi:cytochrome bd-type quinol oxidase subunit 2
MVLNYYAVLVVVAAVLVLTMEAALWISMKNEGPLASHTLAIASKVHWGVSVAVLAFAIVSVNLQQAFAAQPLLWILAVVATTGLFGVRACVWAKLPGAAFLSSAVFVVGFVSSAAFGF